MLDWFYFRQIDIVFASKYSLSEAVQAHATPVVSLVASKPLESNSHNALSGRQRLVSVGKDGEVKLWAIELQQHEDRAAIIAQQQRPVTLQLLFQV